MELIKPNQNIYLTLRNGKQVRELTHPELYNGLVDLIGKAYFEAGQMNNADAGRIAQEAKILCSDLQTDYPTATLQELAEAFRRGVRKHYGEYYGLSVVTYLTWVKSFLSDTARAEAIIKVNYQPKEKVVTDEEKRAIEDQTLQDILTEFRKHGKVYNFGNARYDLLVKRGLIPELAYIEHMEIAERIVYAELNIELENAKSQGNRQQWRNISAELDSIVEGESDAVKKKACDTAVNTWARGECGKKS